MAFKVPRPERHRLPPGTYAAVPAHDVQVYHLVMNDPPEASDFCVGKVVRYELEGWPEIERVGFSCFRTKELADSWRKRQGSMIAVVRLTASMRAHIARSEPPPGHVIVWALPEALAAASQVVEGPLDG